MRVAIETIPHGEQRYPTAGDWWRDPDGTLQIRVSDTGNADHAVLVALHEWVEAALCDKAGVTVEQVDAFDMGHPELDEPGDDPRAPYAGQHRFASAVERLMAHEMGVEWNAYEDALAAL